MSTKKLQIIGSFGPELDSTLVQQGLAADAKAVGEALALKVDKTIKNKYVIDFGLPLQINVNDFDFTNRSVISGAATYGTITIVDGRSLVYTPTTILLGVDSVELTFDDESTCNIDIIPATTMYYEEDFVTLTDSTASTEDIGVWTNVGESISDAYQSIDANNPYGYDSHYTAFTQYSNGGAMKVTVDATTGKSAVAPTATFTFTGTGFDIISLTNSDSGVILVTVKNDEGTTVKTKTVNNYYGYNYGEYVNDEGETVTGWYEVDKGEEAIYQVPVLKLTDLGGYDTYTVQIKVLFLNTYDHQGDGSYSFWLDAIRIYDPALGNEDAEKVYAKDKEYGSTFVNLQSLTKTTFNDTSGTSTSVAKLALKDGKYAKMNKTDDDVLFATMISPGEVVAFQITETGNSPRVYVGVKQHYNVHTGGTSISYIDSYDASSKKTTSRTEFIKTYTEMFYKAEIVRKGANSYVVIKNTDENNFLTIHSAKLFDCEIVVNTDVDSTDVFIANVIDIANATWGVQADWDQTDKNAVDYIKNKPDEIDALELVAELELVSPVAADDGSIYTDENGVLYSL